MEFLTGFFFAFPMAKATWWRCRVIHSSDAGPEKCRDQSAAEAFGQRDSRVVGHLSRRLVKDMAQQLQQIDPGRVCITITGHALIQRERKVDLPAVAGGHSISQHRER